jgi:hypothetical protein
MFDAIDRLQREIDNMHSFGGADYSSGVWMPAFTGFSADPTAICRYVLVGRMCTLFVYMTAPGTSNETFFTMTLPFIAATVTNMIWINAAMIYDNGTNVSTHGAAFILTGDNILYVARYPYYGSWSSWTNVNGKMASFTLSYEIVR